MEELKNQYAPVERAVRTTSEVHKLFRIDDAFKYYLFASIRENGVETCGIYRLQSLKLIKNISLYHKQVEYVLLVRKGIVAISTTSHIHLICMKRFKVIAQILDISHIHNMILIEKNYIFSGGHAGQLQVISAQNLEIVSKQSDQNDSICAMLKCRDQKSVAVGYQNGFSMYSYSSNEKSVQLIDRKANDLWIIGISEVYPNVFILGAYVGNRNSSCLHIYDRNQGSEVESLNVVGLTGCIQISHVKCKPFEQFPIIFIKTQEIMTIYNVETQEHRPFKENCFCGCYTNLMDVRYKQKQRKLHVCYCIAEAGDARFVHYKKELRPEDRSLF